jgi:tetratricopeptide (TPR) repeat protein
MIAGQSVRTPGFQVFEAPAVRDAQLARTTAVVQGYVTREGEVLRAWASVRDEATRKHTRVISATGQPAAILEIAASLAQQLAPSVQPYTTSSAEAVRELYSGAPEKAVGIDPSYGAAHLALVSRMAASGDRDAAVRAVEAAAKSRMTPAEQARLNLVRAELDGDPRARLAALKGLAEATVSDPQTWRAIAELYMNSKNYSAAAEAYGRVLELTPADQVVLNSRGYAFAFAGDLDNARKSLEEYARVAPEAANALDSLGEVHFLFGRYEDAERYFLEAHSKDPSLLGGAEPFRAALARFLAGDTTKADAHFREYMSARSGDELAGLRRAFWMRLTSRKPELRPGTSLEKSMAALWVLSAGQRDAARKLAESARASAALPNVVGFASTVLLLSQPSATVDEWRKRVERALPRPEQSRAREQILGYALLLDRRYAEAAGVWQRVYDVTPGLLINDVAMPFAWALDGAGRSAEARKLLPGFLPPSSIEPGLQWLAYERAVASRQTKH